ncbi:MAG: guanosine-3',5'-bis(diphosphate) 3'-diphosphatase [Proteobacteria bacterium]|nr:MAG: guanosine-3',5'-bis(diphosphate) 3'-diphosphatase [Pseudomonadota bacterium]QKK12621.1 MAG: bifunctional GTP diphosphokinase/guanosine-3',5'-bis pyrophosphate 3'-pyrophosphohydrolase [Pseudomonadota bacterium]
MLEDYLDRKQIAEVYRAYLYSAEAHDGQYRASGEPYVFHPLEVARVMAEMRMDHQSIIAALLHDVLEDTLVSKEQLIEAFGEEEAELVDGVSKLSQIELENPAEAQAENFRKMMLAMTRDIRVILIKLADRLHNMRTLGALKPEKRRRIARETLEIFVPIASRLGMNNLRIELEDLGFAAMYPMRYRVLRKSVIQARGNRKELTKKIETALKRRLREEDLSGRVIGREKHLYSIYRKMREKGLSFTEVQDVYAFRIIVDKVDTCYRVLGAVHNLYKPVPGKFKDYIAIPKANGYQSLHTVLFGPFGLPIEVQIRTEDMHRIAEAGIAAHGLYKAGEKLGSGAQARAREWLRSLLEMQKNAGNSLEFLENVKIDLFPDEIYVFTPKGEIKQLPRGATPVDFAYAVHSDVGNTCVAAKIDRRLAPLRTSLANGQTVEIIAAKTARPNPAWLNFVVTAKARAGIRSYLKKLQREDAVRLGRHLLEKVLLGLGQDPEQLDGGALDRLTKEFQLADHDSLYEQIGLGQRLPELVARRLLPEPEGAVVSGSNDDTRMTIKGSEGMVVSYGKCCRPIPGDRVVGFVSVGRGIVIHTENCKNFREQGERSDKWIDVEWASTTEGDFSVEVRVEVINQRGVLATVAAVISDGDANIEYVNLDERDGANSTLHFTVAVKDRVHLARIMRRIRAIPQVLRIARTKR